MLQTIVCEVNGGAKEFVFVFYGSDNEDWVSDVVDQSTLAG